MGWHPTDLPRAVSAILFRVGAVELPVGRAIVEPLRQTFLSGASVTAPFVVTVLVLGIVFDFVANLLAPFARVLTLLGLTGGRGGVVALGLTLALLLGVVLLAGALAQAGASTGVERRLGRLVGAVPGVGSVYNSFHQMSHVMLDGEVRSFREVKLVEFPHTGLYSLAFQTSAVRVASDGDWGDDELVVLFVPLAPNPVMGGFMVCVPADRVRDVDMTVQEAFQAIVTSGVAMTGPLRT